MQAWGLTDLGCVRAQNQDVYKITWLEPTVVLAVVCDGMGGAKAGNVASDMAARIFTEEIQRLYYPAMPKDALENMLISSAKHANYRVFDESRKNEQYQGMGTTLVAALVCGKYAFLVNIGDSRCYAVGSSGIRQLTIDHSLVQVMLSRGEITAEEARNYPGKNFITRAVGTESTVECDLFTWTLEPGDCLVLCSDGLHGVVDDQEILFEVVHGVRKENCCQRLLDIAKGRGAPDNVTTVLVSSQ